MDHLNYTKEDFITSTEPFEYIEAAGNGFEKEQRKARVADCARSVGVKNFTTLYNAYIKILKQAARDDYTENASNFTGQEFELNTGSWTADDYGVSRIGYGGVEEVACPHPIMPTLRLNNVDTGIGKVKIAFKRGATWNDVVVDRTQIASNNAIVGLSAHEIAVTSENARNLVKYLHDVENLNYDRIPCKKSVSRLGWVGDNGFSPYVKGLVFDGEVSFKSFFESVTQEGSFNKWIDLAREIRKASNPIPKIMLAASFASVLVEPCSCLPFFVHACGGTEAGKTVGLMFAASVWANPEMGKYIHTFNSTAVAQELSASFVNSLPLMLDELQIIKDRKDFDQMIYQLAEGVGRARGEKSGGLKRVGTWRNCMITTGEQPITSQSSGGGAINRIIELSCEDTKLFEDVGHVLKVIKGNFGHAGKRFIELLEDENIMSDARGLQQIIFKELNRDSTEKQALAASLLLTADRIAGKYIFNDDGSFGLEEMAGYLANKDDISPHKRAYEWLQEWILENKNNFIEGVYLPAGRIYGKISNGEVCIMRHIFNDSCAERGFNSTEFLKWMKRNELISAADEKGRTRLDKRVRIQNVLTWCVALKLKDGTETGETIEFTEVQENIPF